jgi:mitofusin
LGNLESALCTSVVTKRVKSKLQPVSTHLTRLLSDVVSANSNFAQSEATKAEEGLKKLRPLLEGMTKGREVAGDALEISKRREPGQRFPAPRPSRPRWWRMLLPVALLSNFPPTCVLGIWKWASEIGRAMLSSLNLAVKLTEDDTRVTAAGGVR